MRRRILAIPTVLAVTFAASVVACEDQPEGSAPGPTLDANVSVDAASANDDAIIIANDATPADTVTPDAAFDAMPDAHIG